MDLEKLSKGNIDENTIIQELESLNEFIKGLYTKITGLIIKKG